MHDETEQYKEWSEQNEPPSDAQGVYLEIVRGQARNKLRKVDEAVYLIGAAPDCDLVLGDPQFPDMHLYLFVKPDMVSMRVLGEGPIASVNGDPVRAGQLFDRDRLRTGPYEFRVHIRNSPRPRKRKTLQPPVRPRSLDFAYQADPAGLEAVERLLADVRADVMPSGRELRVYTEIERSLQSLRTG